MARAIEEKKREREKKTSFLICVYRAREGRRAAPGDRRFVSKNFDLERRFPLGFRQIV